MQHTSLFDLFSSKVISKVPRASSLAHPTLVKTMAEKLPPTSPAKNQPPPKRPNSSLGRPIVTRGATAYNIDSTLRKLGTTVLKPIAAFDGKKLPTNSEILQRLFYVKDLDSSFNKSTRYVGLPLSCKMNTIVYMFTGT